MRLICTILLALFAATGVAGAVDYVFGVPIRIENLRFAESAQLLCNVFGAPGPIGRSGYIAVPLTDGAYHGVVPVSVTLNVGYARADAMSWLCELQYSWRRPPGSRSVGFVERDRYYQLETGQAITSSNMVESGPIGH